MTEKSKIRLSKRNFRNIIILLVNLKPLDNRKGNFRNTIILSVNLKPVKMFSLCFLKI